MRELFVADLETCTSFPYIRSVKQLNQTTMDYHGLIIAESAGHGKAVKGRKRQSTVQVRVPLSDGYIVAYQFRFDVSAGPTAKLAALERAKEVIDTQTPEAIKARYRA